MKSAECSRSYGSTSRKDGKSSTITPALWWRNLTDFETCSAISHRKGRLQNFQNFLVAFERRDQVRTGELGARPCQHVACDFESTIARGGSSGFHGFQQSLGNDDPRHFVVQAQGLLVTVQRPDADAHGNVRLAAEFLQESMPVFGIEERLGHREMRAGFDF